MAFVAGVEQQLSPVITAAGRGAAARVLKGFVTLIITSHSDLDPSNCLHFTAGLEHQVLPVITAAGGAAAMFLWGFATWWLLLAVCSMCATVRQGIPFNLGWWGSVFPLGVYTGMNFGH